MDVVQLEHAGQTPQRDFVRSFPKDIQFNGTAPPFRTSKDLQKQLLPFGGRIQARYTCQPPPPIFNGPSRNTLGGDLIRIPDYFAVLHRIAQLHPEQIEITAGYAKDLLSGLIGSRGFLDISISEPPMLAVAMDDEYVWNGCFATDFRPVKPA